MILDLDSDFPPDHPVGALLRAASLQPTPNGRRIPLAVAPGYRESFDSWIHRYAIATHVRRSGLLRFMGVRDSSSFGDHVPPADRQAITTATGVPDRAIVDMTLERFEYRAIRTPRGNSNGNFTIIGKSVHCRICPHCLRELGSWQVQWRLAFAFACTRHQCLLRDTCPEGHLVQSAPPPRSAASAEREVVRENWQCPTDADGGFCGFDLRLAPVERLGENHPVINAQRTIDAILAGDDENSIWHSFLDIRAIATGVCAEGDIDRIGTVSGLTRDLLVGIGHEGGFGNALAAMESSLMAACVTYALRTLHDLNVTGSDALLIPPLDYARSFANRATPDSIAKRWGKMTPALTRHVARSLGGRSNVHDRLRFYLAADAKRRPVRDVDLIRRRARSVPQLAWPSLMQRLPPARSGHSTRLALSVTRAVLIPGAPANFETLANELLGPAGADSSMQALNGLPANERHIVEEVAIRLADYLDHEPAPIDYERRRRLRIPITLTEHELDKFARLSDGRRSPLKDQEAVAVLHSLVTGSHPRARDAVGGEAFSVNVSFARKSWPLKRWCAMHQVAHQWLERFGIIDEPLLWAPPDSVLDGIDNLRPARSDTDIVTAIRLGEMRGSQQRSSTRRFNPVSRETSDALFYHPRLVSLISQASRGAERIADDGNPV